MAEAFAAVGFAAAIWEFTKDGGTLLKRLREYSKKDPPQTLVDLKDLLTFFDLGLDDIWAKAKAVEEQRKAALEQVVNGCRRQVAALRSILDKLQPTSQSDSRFRRVYKGIRSLQKDNEIRQIEARLQSYLSVLNTFAGSYQRSVDLPVREPSSKDDSPALIYDVSVAAAGRFVGRTRVLESIRETYEIRKDKVVVLAGLGGMAQLVPKVLAKLILRRPRQDSIGA